MRILVTGSKGFISKNLIAELKNFGYKHVYEYDRDTEPSLLNEYCEKADFVFHLAGVNRPKEQSEFMEGNFGFTSILLKTLKKYKNTCPVMISSSIQAELDNPYGKSKKAGEDLLFNYSKETGAKVLVYRFPNVFGKWCKPNYNSAVATFCHNVAHDLPITVNDRSVIMNLVYIDDVVIELIGALKGNEHTDGDYCVIPKVHTITLGEIVDLIYNFKNSRQDRSIPNMSDQFTKKLYSTYLSYLPKDSFSYELRMNKDNRGSFTEFLKTQDRGQVSVNVSKPGITKGNHWHHTKNEKFLVVSGNGVIRFRKIISNEIIEYFVSGDKLEVVDIPTGYTHNIENLGETDMVTIMWANECFDPENPDTYYLEVKL
ncbi:capsular polysaccharide biosynthesis protein CapF [Haloplasma contractile]|uniref:1-deoxy-D-xylulose-5-phosphate reductoisomerase protein n=1 Tax=Haloplasma contractile SSD-17B TaxID=1033810 RepID=U2E7R8_9MOLU|nr:capsular polysaccharide biosynthesis protein CapF [Haloplasma contractile]ERJ10941.1 1-deoxy-D-xylulose-5-phosphate reductoisomerase protein [Haloplasma contractile SSD-17B]